ncbi:MAG: hypothetical protein JOY96_08025 [Verrucomicrobia bacterium]|nr:hypothetical protein [Verrucomicrobiota bacterium]MBV9671980.1 hypothetical protein [Verrucomicrobiota bacterium]
MSARHRINFGNAKLVFFASCFGAILLAGLNACTSIGEVDNRNFSIDTYTPTPNQISLAENRARAWWARHKDRFGANPPYLAVETSAVSQGEIVQNLWPKLIASQTASRYFASFSIDGPTQILFYGVTIFDTRIQRAIGNNGFVIVNTPQRGQVARFGPFLARYIGYG